MNLEHSINWAILNYPTLYRSTNHEVSRLKVLSHYFLSIGTGMEWAKGGYMYDNLSKHPEKKLVKKLPKNFYEIDIWTFDINPKMLKEARQELRKEKIWHHVHKGYFGISVIFSCSRERALSFVVKYECEKDKNQRAENAERFKDFPERRDDWVNRIWEAKTEHPFNPYPIGEFCAIVEMINKRTCSYHVENFELTYVQEDWIKGAIEVVRATLDYFHDESQYSNNSYHPNRCLWDFKDSYKKDPEEFAKRNVERGFPADTSIEDCCRMCFEKFREEQIEYCETFLKMYDKDFPHLNLISD